LGIEISGVATPVPTATPDPTWVDGVADAATCEGGGAIGDIGADDTSVGVVWACMDWASWAGEVAAAGGCEVTALTTGNVAATVAADAAGASVCARTAGAGGDAGAAVSCWRCSCCCCCCCCCSCCCSCCCCCCCCCWCTCFCGGGEEEACRPCCVSRDGDSFLSRGCSCGCCCCNCCCCNCCGAGGGGDGWRS